VKIRILIVDDFPLMREGFADALSADPGLKVVGQAGDGLEAIEKALELRPDVILLDLYMQGFGGISAIERLRTEVPEAKILVVTASERAETLLEAIAAGASGYLTKRASREELRQAVITVHGGGSLITPMLAGHLLRDYARRSRGEDSALRPLIGAREHEILRLVAQGYTDRDIGEALSISARTVQNHLGRIRQKTGLRRRSELTRWAVEHAIA
jgi:DNA-binding NarL/FixJ family response regulator